MNRRQFIGSGAALAGALALPARAATALKVAYIMAPQFGAAYIAKERGFFDKQGLDVTLQLIGMTSTVPAAIVSDSVQIGGMSPTVFLQAVEGGLDLVTLAAGALQDAALNEVQVVAGAGKGIKTPADLAGRKLGLPGLNGALHVMTVSWLKRNHVDPANVTLVEVPFPRMDAVLHGGNVDAVVAVEPFITNIVKAGIGVTLPGLAQSLKDGSATTVWVASRKWADANATAVKGFRSALADAVAFAKADLPAARSAIRQYFKVPPGVIEAIPFPPLQSGISDAALRHWVELMLDQGLLKQAPKVSSLIAH
jgi:NitT/TauT family transport system substrate-binding protein